MTATATRDLTGSLVRFTLPTHPVVGIAISHDTDRLGVFPETYTVRAVGEPDGLTHAVPVDHVKAIDLPPLTGDVYGRGTDHEYDARARIYTVAQLPFHALPGHLRGGPTLAGLDAWSVSYTAHSATGMWSLTVIRLDKKRNIVAHALNDTTWPTESDAREAAYNHGLVGFMVYEKDAARWGLPAPALESATA